MDRKVAISRAAELTHERNKSSALNNCSPINNKPLMALICGGLFLFVVGIFAPSISVVKLLIFTKSYSIFTGAFSFLGAGMFTPFALVIVFLVLIPALHMFVLFWIAIKIVPSKIALFVTVLFHKYRMIGVSLLVITIAALEFGVFDNMKASFGIYIYLFSIISMVACSSMALSSLRDAGKYSNQIAEITGRYEDNFSSYVKSTLKLCILIILLLVAFNIVNPLVLESFKSETAVNGRKEHAPVGASSTEYTPRERAVYETYNDMNTTDPNFDVGGYCLAKEKKGGISFEECLGVAAAKLMSK